MNPGNSVPNRTEEAKPSGTPSSALARAALVASIFAFIPPLGLAAIVMGHIADGGRTSLQNGRAMARAALWIAYIQLVLVLSAAFIFWTAFRGIAISFQRDAIVQRLFRSSDREQPIDRSEVADMELAARTILIQLIAIEDHYRRSSKVGAYACRMNELVAIGVEGTTESEKRSFELRMAEAPYLFEISDCSPGEGDSKEAGYFLTAVPRHPRMPEWAAIYCANENGTMRQVRSGTSLDCLKHGDPLP
jgi:hypothetical protein